MALLYDDIRYDRFTIDEFQAHKTVNESYSRASEVSSHPRETGTNVSDGIHVGPLEIQLEGIITDASMSGADIGASQRAFEALYALQEEKRPMTLVSARGTFENMVIANVNVPSSAPGSLYIFLQLIQVDIVTAGVTTLPGEVLSRSSRVRNKSTALATAPEQDAVWLPPYVPHRKDLNELYERMKDKGLLDTKKSNALPDVVSANNQSQGFGGGGGSW